MSKKALSPKQAAFVDAYLSNGRNAAAAYRGAYNTKGSAAAAANEGLRLLKHPDIAPIIAQAHERATQAVEQTIDRFALTQENVAKSLALLGKSDIRRILSWDAQGNVTVIPSDKISDEDAFGISEVQQTKDGLKIKMHEKRGPLTDLGRHFGMFVDKVEVSGTIDLADRVRRAKARRES